jgi:hypothetical protein
MVVVVVVVVVVDACWVRVVEAGRAIQCEVVAGWIGRIGFEVRRCVICLS